MELVHVEAFIAGALARGRLSPALGTAIQFETAMRQKDVIGEWTPIAAGESMTGIVLNGRRWANGLTWSDLAADLVVRKANTKTGAFAVHDLKFCAIVLAFLERVPADRRIGPLIIDETADAGTNLDHIRSAAAHAQGSTTLRYSRGAIGKSRAVAELCSAQNRMARRA